MKCKIALIALGLALVLTNAFWIFVVFDQGVTYTYMESSLEMSQKQFEQAAILANLELKGLSPSEAVERIGKDVYGLDPFIKEGCIWAGQVCLAIENDRVVGINHDAL